MAGCEMTAAHAPPDQSDRRESGILLHITSLPSAFGIGDLGPGAYRFVDFLARGEQAYWQILPLNPTLPEYDHSPYHGTSAFAGNTLLISPDLMVSGDFLDPWDLEGVPPFPGNQVDYEGVIPYKHVLFDLAFDRFRIQEAGNQEYRTFCRENAWWLDDYALYTSLSRYYGGVPWNEWPEGIRSRRPKALDAAQHTLINACMREKFLQYLFFLQWEGLRTYCHKRGIRIIGDMPLYVTYDSADVWVHPELFALDARQAPEGQAGVPPDYFNVNGQLWGNPLYRWEAHRAEGYQWWMERFAQSIRMYDLVRIDHFRGLVAFWEVGPGELTASNGRWVQGPGSGFIEKIFEKFPGISLIAEDLGVITPDVTALMNEYRIPGMRVLLFGFLTDDRANPNHPDNITGNCVVYTGTHDNNTARGWFSNEASDEEIRRLFSYCRRAVREEEVAGIFMEMALRSPATRAILPLQEVCGSGSEARMNRPGTTGGNWRWRAGQEELDETYRARLKELTIKYHRSPVSRIS